MERGVSLFPLKSEPETQSAKRKAQSQSSQETIDQSPTISSPALCQIDNALCSFQYAAKTCVQAGSAEGELAQKRVLATLAQEGKCH